MNFQFARSFVATALTQLGAATPAATALPGAICKLFQVGLSPNPDTPLADFDAAEADFSGYAASDTITWNAPVREGAWGEQLESSITCPFTQTATTTVNTVAGYYLTSGDDTILIGSRLFDSPIAMANVGDNITIVPAVPIDCQQTGEDAVLST